MSGPFPSFDIASSGLRVSSTWMDAIAHNIANIQTTVPADQEPFRAARPILAEKPGEGVDVVGMVADESDPQLYFDPRNPRADATGHVAQPVVDLPGEMVDMMVASRAYQANLNVVQSAREAYEAAMRIGR